MAAPKSSSNCCRGRRDGYCTITHIDLIQFNAINPHRSGVSRVLITFLKSPFALLLLPVFLMHLNGTCVVSFRLATQLLQEEAVCDCLPKTMMHLLHPEVKSVTC